MPESPPAIKDTNTPEWVQHLALVVEDEEELLEKKAKLEAAGVDVIGPTDHGFCRSIYFFDPNGHRLELTVRTETPEMMERLSSSSAEMLEEWTKTKTVQKQAAWIHGGWRGGITQAAVSLPSIRLLQASSCRLGAPASPSLTEGVFHFSGKANTVH